MQACHAAYEVGSCEWAEGIFQVLCQTDNEQTLLEAEQELKKLEIPYILIREPDIGNKATALATFPLVDWERKKLRHWKLYKH